MDYSISRFGKLTVGNYCIKVIGHRPYGKRFKFEYGLYDSNENLISKNINIEKLKELASKKQKESDDISN